MCEQAYKFNKRIEDYNRYKEMRETVDQLKNVIERNLQSMRSKANLTMDEDSDVEVIKESELLTNVRKSA